ncbi:hypothetical protein EB118_17085 [bacterium]|nr:hypothetical protein [bacterium]
MKFRPQDFIITYHFRGLRPRGQYNWIPRMSWNNKNYLLKVWSVLHYRSTHAPNPIKQKWHITAEKFQHRHKRIL